VQHFSVGSTNSEFAYIGLGVSQEFPYPGKLGLRGEVAKREPDVGDFTMIRVYTWGARRRHYETPYVEAGNEERRYAMRQTVVRRVRDDQKSSTRPHPPARR